MSSIVIILVPHSDRHQDSEVVLREAFGVEEETIQISDAAAGRVIEDAEHLPLWRWFSF